MENQPKENPSSLYRNGFVAISIILFVASLFSIGFKVDNPPPSMPPNVGILLVLLGWSGLPAFPSWLANPALLISWFLHCLGERTATAYVAVIGFLLSLCFLFHSEFGGSKITSLEYGYWLWVFSIAIMALGSVVILIRDFPEKSAVR